MTRAESDALFAVARKERERQRKAVEARVDAIIQAVSEASGVPVASLTAKSAPSSRGNPFRNAAMTLVEQHCCNGLYTQADLGAKFNVGSKAVCHAKAVFPDMCKAVEIYQKLKPVR